MRIIIMGTGPFAVPTFESLLESQHDVVVLVTRPTPPVRSRGKAPRNPMREVAVARGIEVLSPDDVNSVAARKQLASLRPELYVVCDFGQILSPETLSIAPLGGINLHGSLLPKYRGAAPVQWAILNGELETGITVIHMTPKLDGGPMLALRSTPIGDSETTEELEPRLSLLGVEPVHEAIAMLAAWDRESPIGTPQDPALACRAPRLKKSDGAVDWSRSAVQIYNQFRALKPWPGTFTHWHRPNGEPLRLLLDEIAIAAGSAPHASTPGSVLVSDGTRLEVATGDGILLLRKIQPAGKRVMAIDEFLRGCPIPVGDRFGGSC
ncbi:MAG: methionyl-tRNA formyltransferase [Planctomycetia bacterium]|nr:methionyl-tRNA formyltransferase [Planctomycetia bacterium]